MHIKTHDSESRGQEETAIIRETKNTRPLSELFTRKSVKKLTNALVKPPYALSLSYHRLMILVPRPLFFRFCLVTAKKRVWWISTGRFVLLTPRFWELLIGVNNYKGHASA